MIGEDRCAQHQDQVVAGEARHNLLAVGGEEAGKQRVVLGKAVAARIGAGPDFRPVPFGEGDDLVPGVVAGHGGADDEGRPHALGQGLGHNRQQIRVAARHPAEPTRFDRIATTIPIVDRHRDKGGPARRLHCGVVGARDRQGHILGARRLAAPLDVGPRELGRPLGEQEGLERQYRARLLSGDDQERRLVLGGGEHRPQGVTETGGRVQVDHGGVARRLGIAVGHPDRHHLLQGEHIAKIGREVAEHRQFGRARVTEDRRRPKGAEQVEDPIPHRPRPGTARHRNLLRRGPKGHSIAAFPGNRDDDPRWRPRALDGGAETAFLRR